MAKRRFEERRRFGRTLEWDRLPVVGAGGRRVRASGWTLIALSLFWAAIGALIGALVGGAAS